MGMDDNLDIKSREQLYRMMISQLFYDGFQNIAVTLSSQVKAHPACPPSDRLTMITALGLKAEEEHNDRQKEINAPPRGIDLEYETEAETMAPEASLYETVYVTAHKGPCRTAAYHPNGKFVATASEDASIKILDVERMKARAAKDDFLGKTREGGSIMDSHPVVRTLYDHAAEVTAIDFHPSSNILASGSKDFTIKFFEYAKPSVKKASKIIQEAAEIRCMKYHPSGDYLLVGTQQSTVRLFDASTFQCFVSSNPKDNHSGPITSVNWSPNASLFVTSSKDGDLKIWDGVSNKLVNMFQKAHDGHEVCSAVFSRNSKYILSCGKDSLVKLWELSTSRCLIAYTGAGTTGKMESRTQAIFNHTEDYVLFPDEKTTSLCCWDSRNADRQRLLALGHNNIVKCIVHSPSETSFVTCSDDYRARFWYKAPTIGL